MRLHASVDFIQVTPDDGKRVLRKCSLRAPQFSNCAPKFVYIMIFPDGNHELNKKSIILQNAAATGRIWKSEVLRLTRFARRRFNPRTRKATDFPSQMDQRTKPCSKFLTTLVFVLYNEKADTNVLYTVEQIPLLEMHSVKLFYSRN